MPAIVRGRLNWSTKRDKEGHRDYNIQWLVQSGFNDGPERVASAVGLPAIGTPWTYGNDNDLWAMCHPDLSANPVLTKEPNQFWTVDQTFSTRPLHRCQDTAIDNPVMEPFRLGGGFFKTTKEATEDRDGNPLITSSKEVYRGPLVEKEVSSPFITIGYNSATLDLSLVSGLIDHLNDAPMWGLGAEQVMFTNYTWSRRLFGTCSFYYPLDMDFEVNQNGFTRRLLDEGTQYLAPGGDPTKQEDFIQYKDKQSENKRVLLNGSGGILQDITNPHYNEFDLNPTGNLLALGIPGTF